MKTHWQSRMDTTSTIHEPTFTEWRGSVGLYCSCGYVWGMGNRLGASNAWDNHYARMLTGEGFHA